MSRFDFFEVNFGFKTLRAVDMYGILIPFYNDEESLKILINELDNILRDFESEIDVYVVNDGGRSCAPYLNPPKKIREIIEIELVVNLGHQRAIAIGLTELARSYDYEAVVIMDADGEDNPSDVLELLNYHLQHPEYIIVASRQTRSENLKFRLFYRLYQMIFYLLTGKKIDFGNFMLLPKHIVSTIVYHSNLWNHLAATILSSKLPLIRLKTTRGKRYIGESKMNFENLVAHGLSAMSVYLISIFTRLLTVLGVAFILSIVSIGVVIGIRFFTDLAIPGWATNLIGILLILISQLIVLILIPAFATLNQRSNFTGVPISKLNDYIKTKKTINKRLS